MFAEDTEKSGNTSDDPVRFELDEITVTAQRAQDRVRDIARNVSVITSADIAQSPGSDVADLLSRESGIHIRRNSGSGKRATIDIRGMGDTAASNVIVMVDGLKVNSPDMSGQNLTSVPAEEIERIEIVRGAGSVVYGNGAVGGVVNIITKKGGKKQAASVFTSYGSYDTYDVKTAYSNKIKDLRFKVNAGLHDSDGYRDNGFYRKKNFSADTDYRLTDRIKLMLAGTYQEEENGLPGTVPLADLDAENRRKQTTNPNDEGETDEIRARGGIEFDLEKWGTLSVKRGYRFRDNEYIIGYTPLLSRNEQTDEIDEDTRQFDIDYTRPFDFLGRSHRFQFGVNYYQTHYVREEMPNGPRKNSETDTLGIFVNNRWALTEKTTFTWGYRHNNYQGKFRTDARQYFAQKDVKRWINGEVERREWDNDAYHFGVTWDLLPDTTVFASYASSFRVPNVDEFAESEKGLGPQEGKHFEIGSRRQFGSLLELSVALYDIRTDDEIYYSEINRNYDDTTIRRGVETDVKIYPADFLYLWGNYTYTEAEFEKSGNTVPLVPEHKASAGVEFDIIDPLTLSFSGTYTGSRYDGNDTENNRYEKLDAYWVFDGKVMYRHKSLELFASVNNIFNELYATNAYSQAYYPMPDRNFAGGLRWTF
ncbi:MAG: TonB-dependent receptor [Thermodesulfobacteriota bacterium]